MQELISETVEKTKKKEIFIKLFLNKRCIWENKDCYKFLSRRQYQVSIMLLKNLSDFDKCSQQKLLVKTKEDFKKYIDEKLIEHEGLPSRIKSSQDAWIIRKKKGKNEYRITIFNRTVCNTLNYMISFFIYRKQIWDTTKKRPGAYILCLNKRGRKIVEEILKREEDSKKQIVEQVITQQ